MPSAYRADAPPALPKSAPDATMFSRVAAREAAVSTFVAAPPAVVAPALPEPEPAPLPLWHKPAVDSQAFREPAPLAPIAPPAVPEDTRRPGVAPAHPLFETAALDDTLHAPVPPRGDGQGKLATLYRAPDEAAPPQPAERTARRRVGRPAIIGSAAALTVLVILSAVVGIRLLTPPATLNAMFTAPMLVLRAAGAAQVVTVAAAIGQPVDPATVLMTLHATPTSDVMVDELKARLAQARTRQGTADDPLAWRQKDAVAVEIDQLQKAIASATGAGAADQPLLAGIRGIVWSLNVEAGAKLRPGEALAQLADCGRAFLVLRDKRPALKAGQAVLIRMAGLRPFQGAIRPSVGVMEPADSLVIEPTGFNAVAANACPVGASAEIEPQAPL